MKYSLRNRKPPLEIGLPWWSFGAIKFMRGHLKPEMSVFEYGPGGSTVFAARLAGKVIATEDEQAWVDLLSAELKQQGLNNVELLARPYDFWNVADFESSAYLHSIPVGEVFDVLVIDGKEWDATVRDRCFWHAENFVKPGGIIVVDDSWRYPELKHKNRAMAWREWRGTGPCRLGVTSTCVFFY